MIRTLIVDDEPLAREGLRLRLVDIHDIEVMGEAVDGPSAVEAITHLLPDLVILDVQMPGLNGFDVLARVASRHVPAVIFVTAYEQYALKAFEVHALDYLLKPFTSERLHHALERTRRELARGAGSDDHRKLAGLLGERDIPEGGGQPWARRWVVKENDHFVLLRADEVEWIEAAGNYIRFHARGSAFLMRGTMSALEGSLDPKHFARIHRSTIVNLNRVREIRPEWHGDYDVVLVGGKTLRLGRHFRKGLLG